MKLWLLERGDYLLSALRVAYRLSRDLFIDFAILVSVFVYNDVQTFREKGRSIADIVSANNLASSIVPTFLALLVLFTIRLLVVAPFRLHKNQQAAIAQLTDTLKTYQDRAAHKLTFVFEEHKYPYEILEKQSGNDLKVWLFRVGVKNLWHERLTQCSVKLESISPHGEKFLPKPMKLAVDNPPDVLNMAHQQTFAINADDTTLIDVVKVHQRPSGATAEVCYALEGIRDIRQASGLVGGDTWFLTLKAMAEMGKPFMQTFVIKATPTEVSFARFKMPGVANPPSPANQAT